MPLSKAKNRERMRKVRATVQPACNLDTEEQPTSVQPVGCTSNNQAVQPNEAVQPSIVDRLPERTCSFRLKAVPKPR